MEFKETDIRPDRLMQGQIKHTNADRRRLLSHKGKFVSIPCPACNSRKARIAFKKGGLTYKACLDCETLYVNPRPTAAILEKCYAESEVYAYWNKYIFPQSDAARRKNIICPRVDRLIEICRRYAIKNATLLEVGSAFGTFCEEAKSRGFFSRVIAVEPTPDLAETCRRKGLEVIEKPIEQIKFQPGTINVVVSFEVIEHLFSPRDFLRSCAAVLSPGGLLVLSCPSCKGFDIVTLQSLSASIDHEHLNYFNPNSLPHLVERCGFETLEVLTPGVLDAEIVRKKILSGEFDVSEDPFLKQILIDDWGRVSQKFQKFLSDNLLSSHMWLVARKK
ncbi:MAG TPA: class I SAM-dependent methyltransferase [Candidatus Omnitrophota bacterium]|nr:class I SAM-dependent methyltransferase [Candidatus Omnitrophota bacterium]HPD84105.1 class I SAM-dependent methyltransferase [Candidatus Omnitrophota bacterium]HRZ02962.1 class I SAM-dependent methyltransferase [Candidatus Omnitrophota bacterium]